MWGSSEEEKNKERLCSHALRQMDDARRADGWTGKDDSEKEEEEGLLVTT